MAPSLPGCAAGSSGDTFRGSWVGVEQRVELQPSPLFKLTVGGEGQAHFDVRERAGDEGGAFLDDKHPYQVGAGYALVDLKPSERLHVSAGRAPRRLLDVRALAESAPSRRGATLHGWQYEADAGQGLPRAKRVRALLQRRRLHAGGEPAHWAREHLLGRARARASLLGHGVGHGGRVCNYARDLVSTAGQGDMTDTLRYVNADAPIATVGAELGHARDWRQGYMLAVSYSWQRSRSSTAAVSRRSCTSSRAPTTAKSPISPEHLGSVKGALPLLGRALTLASRLSLESGRYDRNERQDRTKHRQRLTPSPSGTSSSPAAKSTTIFRGPPASTTPSTGVIRCRSAWSSHSAASCKTGERFT